MLILNIVTIAAFIGLLIFGYFMIRKVIRMAKAFIAIKKLQKEEAIIAEQIRMEEERIKAEEERKLEEARQQARRDAEEKMMMESRKYPGQYISLPEASSCISWSCYPNYPHPYHDMTPRRRNPRYKKVIND